jgi:ArsR family transcriptional regulator
MDSVSPLADTNVLLDVLGNESRRKILSLISHEPMYFNQLAREMGTAQQAILRHVKILEDSGMIGSYIQRSNLGAPDRKYYKLNSSFNINISVSHDNFTIRNQDITESRYKESDSFYKRFDELNSIVFHQIDSLKESTSQNVNAKHVRIRQKSMVSLGRFLLMLQQNLYGVEEQILHLETRLNDLRALKQSIIKKIHETEKVNFDEVERRLICLIMEETIPQKENKITVSELAEILDLKERTIKNVLARITDKLGTKSNVRELFKNVG